MSGIIFEDIFEVKDLDVDGRKFDRVSRFRGESENYEMNLLLDYNNEVFSVGISDKFTLALATTLDLDGTSSSKISEKDQYYDPLIGTEEKPSLLDRYDYVMHGKVYKFKTQNDEKRSVYVSYGGLLMRLTGDPRNMQSITPNMALYLLIRKA